MILKKLLCIFVIFIALLLSSTIEVKAFCGWTLNNVCRDLGNGWVRADQDNYCAGDPCNGTTNKCCCGPTGCCIVNNTSFNTEQANCTGTFQAGKIGDGQGGCADFPKCPTKTSTGTAPGNTSTGTAPGYSSSGTAPLSTPSQLTNPLGTTEIPVVIGKVINAFLLIIGSIALLMFIYGGITWMTAAGNESRVEKGRNILMWAALGLVIIFAAYVLVRFVMEAIGVG